MRLSFRFILLLALLGIAVAILLRDRSTPEPAAVADPGTPAATAATARQAAAGPRAPDGTWVYDCGQDFRFTVLADGPTRVRVILPDREVILTQVEAASGARYEAAGYIYWTREGQCRLETPDGIYAGCDNDIEEAIWEDARRRGIGFRAWGVDPFWQLEIGAETIVMETGADSSRHRFPAVEPVTSDSGEITYRTLREGHGLVVTVLPAPCEGDGAGVAQAAAKAVAVLDGRIYRGCGRPVR